MVRRKEMMMVTWKNILILSLFSWNEGWASEQQEARDFSAYDSYYSSYFKLKEPLKSHNYSLQGDVPLPYDESLYATFPQPTAPYIEENSESVETTATSPLNDTLAPRALDSMTSQWQVIHEETPEGFQLGPRLKEPSLQSQLLLQPTPKEPTFTEMYKEIQSLKDKNNILEELLKLAQINQRIGLENQKQLGIISEALGLEFEQSARNQEQMMTSIESIQDRLSLVKKTIESNQKSTLYMVYHTVQGGLRILQAGTIAAATFKTLSIVPAFIIPGWSVYVGALAAGSFVYFAKL